jgi:hypothetical protein
LVKSFKIEKVASSGYLDRQFHKQNEKTIISKRTLDTCVGYNTDRTIFNNNNSLQAVDEEM